MYTNSRPICTYPYTKSHQNLRHNQVYKNKEPLLSFADKAGCNFSALNNPDLLKSIWTQILIYSITIYNALKLTVLVQTHYHNTSDQSRKRYVEFKRSSCLVHRLLWNVLIFPWIIQSIDVHRMSSSCVGPTIHVCTYNNECPHQNCHHNHQFRCTLESYSSNEISLYTATGLVDTSQALKMEGKKAKLVLF